MQWASPFNPYPGTKGDKAQIDPLQGGQALSGTKQIVTHQSFNFLGNYGENPIQKWKNSFIFIIFKKCMKWDLNPCGLRQQVLNLPP